MDQNLNNGILDTIDTPTKTVKTPTQEEKLHCEPKEPELYLVFAQDDRTTPVNFVEETLRAHFNLSAERIRKVIELAERNGKAFVQSYPKDVAESKVKAVNQQCRSTPNSVTGGNMELLFTCVPSY